MQRVYVSAVSHRGKASYGFCLAYRIWMIRIKTRFLNPGCPHIDIPYDLNLMGKTIVSLCIQIVSQNLLSLPRITHAGLERCLPFEDAGLPALEREQSHGKCCQGPKLHHSKDAVSKCIKYVQTLLYIHKYLLYRNIFAI